MKWKTSKIAEEKPVHSTDQIEEGNNDGKTNVRRLFSDEYAQGTITQTDSWFDSIDKAV